MAMATASSAQCTAPGRGTPLQRTAGRRLSARPPAARPFVLPIADGSRQPSGGVKLDFWSLEAAGGGGGGEGGSSGGGGGGGAGGESDGGGVPPQAEEPIFAKVRSWQDRNQLHWMVAAHHLDVCCACHAAQLGCTRLDGIGASCRH